MVMVPSPQPSPDDLLKKSVHVPGDPGQNPINSGSMLLMVAAAMADGMVQWGTLPKQRDRQLREFWPSESYLAGATATVVARNVSFDWKLEGGTATADQATEILENSEYGKGWKHLWTKLCLDFYTQDCGAFVQIIRQNPEDPLSPFVNLTHLDAGRCYQTGQPQTPIAYLDRKNRWHFLKWFQVRNLMEMPAPVESIFAGTLQELQYCAITRMLKAAQIIRNITVQKDEKTAGRFLRAIHVIGGVSQKELQDAIDGQRDAVDNAGLMRYVQPLIVSTLDPGAKVSKETLELASMPEGWDEEKSLKSYLIAMAMGFLTDYQEFSPLPGGNLGSGAQSNVLHLKSTGKGPMLYKAAVSQLMNFGGILPKNVTFKWDEQDVELDKAEADVSKTRAEARAVMIANGEIDDLAARAMAVSAGDLDEGLVADLESRDEQRKLEAAAAQQAQVDALAAQPKTAANGAVPGVQPSQLAAKMLEYAEKSKTGAMVALFPSPGLAGRLAVDGGEPPEDLHVTLAFLGDACDVDGAAVIFAVRAVAASFPPMDGEISGIGRFSIPDGDAFYASVDLPDVNAFQQALVTALAEAGVAAADNHGWTAHMTLAYLDSMDPAPLDRMDTVPVRFDSVVVALGPERTVIDLAGSGSKALPPGRKKAERAAQSIIQHEVFDDIFAKVAARLTAAHAKDLASFDTVDGKLKAKKDKPKRTRTKVIRDSKGAISETITEES